MNEKTPKLVSTFLKRTISKLINKEVDSVTDLEGYLPSLLNSYLMTEEGDFAGVFQSGEDYYFFTLENSGDSWRLVY